MAVNDLPADWNKPCSEKHLAEISLWIRDWKEISPFLRLTQVDESKILVSAPNCLLSQTIKMLRLWKEKRGRKATYNSLCLAFTKLERLDIVEKVKELLANDSSGSSSDEEDSSSNLTSYESYLKELYRSMSSSNTSQHWTHLPRTEFTELAMIKEEAVRRGGPEEEMIRLAHLGKIETIMSHKKPIKLHKLLPFPIPELPHQYILQPPPPPGRVLLIEGAPGGGKSSLALHFCHQWAQGESWLSGYDVVILAYLRDQAVQNAKTLAEILPARNFIMSKNAASQILATDGKNALFVLDGWDEFPRSLMKDSFVSRLIQKPQKLSLHRSTVLVTSRPVASGNLLPIADQRVEILGFTQQQIHDYIKKALKGNGTRTQKLVQHLEDHPVIEGYCYIPLHVAILVHIFLTMKEALPTTLHELFCSLVLCCIVREHETHEPKTCLPELSSLDDLPDDLKFQLGNLSTLAYNGVTKDKIVFYLEDLEAFRLPADLPSLGLLQAVEGLTQTGKTLSYNFLHLSVQELLAAYHISQMAPSEQAKVFEELFNDESSRFQAVLHYYSGFTKLNNLEIQKFISSYQSNKSKFVEILPLLHCFLEAQQPSLCQLVDAKFIPSERDELLSENFSPVDFLAIGYFITSLLSTSVTTFHLSIKKIDDHRLKLLLTGLSKYSVRALPKAIVLYRKLALELNTPAITHQGVRIIASFLEKSSLIYKLTICNGEIQHNDCKDGLLHIVQTLQTGYSSLTCLNVHNMNLQHCTKRNSYDLTEMLQLNRSLTHLDLSNNAISDSGTWYISLGLYFNTTLVYLSLKNTGIRVTEATWVKSMLKNNKSLKHLDLSDNAVSDSGTCHIFESLKRNNTLVYLSLRNTGIRATDPRIAKSLNEMLMINKSLKHLDLSNNAGTISADSDACTCYIVEGLQHNSTLVHLSLRNTGITAVDAGTARFLTVPNKSLTYLDLSNDDFFAANDLQRYEHNNTIPQLVLSGIHITDNAAAFIGQILISNCSLQILDIYESNLGNGFHHILDGLKCSTSLKQLYVSELCILMPALSEGIQTARKEKKLPPIEIITPGYY